MKKLHYHPVYAVAKRTPLQKAHKLSKIVGHEVHLKREDLQPVHSFKIRGAYHKIQSLSKSEKACGVIAASAGNHAQGVALSAKKLGLKSLIVMPKTTPAIKIEAVQSYGSQVELAGDNYSEAFEHCQTLIQETGMTFIHPFDDPLVIEGQGTVGLELLEQLATATHVFVPVGGGGLLAGIAKVIKKHAPHIQIIGVEPDDSNAMMQSIQAGEIKALPHVGIFADGVAVKVVGTNTFKMAQRYVDHCISVSTDEICAAIKYIFEDTRSIVEPAGALGVAGIVAMDLPKGSKAIAICSGANMSFERLQFIAERTLLGSGQESLFAVELPEKPNALKTFCEEVIGEHNITEFNYRLQSRNKAHIFVGVSTRSREDKQAFMQKMSHLGYIYTDLSDDDISKEHIRHMVGGPSSLAQEEKIFSVGFPERPGALRDFLNIIGGENINISLFHYRGKGGDVGRVLIGFETNDADSVLSKLSHSNYDVTAASRLAIDLFL